MSNLTADLFDGLIKLAEKQDGFISTEDLKFFKKHAEEDNAPSVQNRKDDKDGN